MSRRIHYLGGSSIVRPTSAGPSEEAPPIAAKRAQEGEEVEKAEKLAIIAKLVEAQSRVSEIEHQVRWQEISPAAAKHQLVGEGLRERALDLVKASREARFRRPPYRLGEFILRIDWLMGQLDRPSSSFFYGPFNIRREASKTASPPVAPRDLLEARLHDALASGLFSKAFRPSVWNATQCRFDYIFGTYLKTVPVGQPIHKSVRDLLYRCEAACSDDSDSKVRTLRRNALDRLRTLYIERSGWIGRGRTFCWSTC